MKVLRAFLGITLAVLAVSPLIAQAPVLSSIQAPYANLQAQVKMAGSTYGAGSVAYGPVGTPLILGGSNFGTTGTVQFIPYVHGVAGAPVQAAVTTWNSTMINVTVPAGATSGLVKATVSGSQSNGLPFIVTAGDYGASCPVTPSNSVLQIFTSGLADGAVGQAYSMTLEAGGGTPAYNWSIVSGALPTGLALDPSTGVISGTPTQSVQSVSLTVHVTDTSSPTQTASAVLYLTVEPSTTPTVVYDYCIGTSNSNCTSTGPGYDPVGNLLNYNDSVTGTWSMTDGDGDGGYDTLNRLIAASATSGPYAGLQATWNYDSFGNRTFENFSGDLASSSAPPIPPSSWAQYNANNQVQSSSTGVTPSYDGSGDVIQDDQNQYLYDADGRICAVHDLLSGQMMGYLYDAEGHRIGKGTIQLVNGQLSCDTTQNGFAITASYILSPDNQQLTEMTWSGNQVQFGYTNVRAAGQLIASYTPGSGSQVVLNFQLRDWLGTLRAHTDYAGNVQEKCESLPFGNGQTCVNSEYLFTGKERDAESGNDYFGARYYASSMGRMLSPDPGNLSAIFHMDDPQSWNGYAYAHNNPLRFTDPTGDTYQVCDANGQNCSNLDDKTFETDQAKDQKNGEYFQNGTMFHMDDNGNKVTDGTYKQTDVDMPGDAGANIAAMGQIARNGQGAINWFMTQQAMTLAGGAAAWTADFAGGVIGGYISASKLAMVKPLVTNPKLAEIVDELFQATDKIPGGTAGAVRFESESGVYLSPKGHFEDAQNIRNQLNNLLKNPNTSWSSNDQAVAKELIRDLQNALK